MDLSSDQGHLLFWSILLGLVEAAVPLNSTDTYLASTLGRFQIVHRHHDHLVQNLLMNWVPTQGQTLGPHSTEEGGCAKNHSSVWGLTVLHSKSWVRRKLRDEALECYLENEGGFGKWEARGRKAVGLRERQGQRPEAKQWGIWPQSSRGPPDGQWRGLEALSKE